MYLRVQLEESDLTYKLDRNEILVGSSAVCDLIVQHSSISKKHMKLVIENGKCFASDVGSTNGTFIEDSRMVPGKRFEFEFNEKIRLGIRCTLTLLEKCDYPFPLPGPKESPSVKNTSTESDEDKTRVVSLKDLKFGEQKKRSIPAATKKAEIKKPQKTDSQRLRKVFIICMVIMAFGYVVNKMVTDDHEPDVDTIINKVNKNVKRQVEVLDRN